MNYSIPSINQYPWDQALSYHIDQLSDKNTGGINYWNTRPIVGVDGQPLTDRHEGYTGYDAEEEELIRWTGQEWERLSTGGHVGDIEDVLGAWDNPPSNPVPGLIGFNPSLRSMEIWDDTNSEWVQRSILEDLEIPSWDTGTRPGNPELGTIGYNTDDPGLEYWYINQWVKLNPSEPPGPWKIISGDATLEIQTSNLVNRPQSDEPLKLKLPQNIAINRQKSLVIASGPAIDEDNIIEISTTDNTLINDSEDPFLITREKRYLRLLLIEGRGWVSS